jgi:hypothetical protein
MFFLLSYFPPLFGNFKKYIQFTPFLYYSLPNLDTIVEEEVLRYVRQVSAEQRKDEADGIT